MLLAILKAHTKRDNIVNRQEIIEKLKGYRANGKEIGDLRRSTAELQSELEALEQSTRATTNTRGKRTCEKHNRA